MNSSLWVKWQNSKPITDHQNQISELKKARMEGALRTAKVVENWRPLVLQIFSSNWAETDIEAKRAFQCMTNLHSCNFILCLYSGHFRFGSIFYNFLSFYCLFISIPNIAGGSFRIFITNHLFYKVFNRLLGNGWSDLDDFFCRPHEILIPIKCRKNHPSSTSARRCA